jgi:hypothetical protein
MVFGVNNQNRFQYYFQPIQMDMSVLYASMQPLVTASNLGVLAKADYLMGLGPVDIIPPWAGEDPDNPTPLHREMAKIRGMTSFINMRDSDIRDARSDKDSQSLFAMYKALKAMRSMAQYAALKTTPESSLTRLSAQFSSAMTEVANFMPTAEWDRLNMFFGSKNDDVKVLARLGDNSPTYLGDVIQTGPAVDPLANVTGTETFNIRLTKKSDGSFDDIAVDLSNITGDLSINNIVAEINAQIEAVVDGVGDPIYFTRFSVDRNSSTGDYSIKVEGTINENVNLTADAAEPALIITSTRNSYLEDDETTGLMTKLTDAEGAAPNRNYLDEVAIRGVDIDATFIAEKTADAEDAEESNIAKFEALTGTTVVPEEDEETTTPTETTGTTKDTANNMMDFDVDPVSAETIPNAVAIDSEGYTYVVGNTEGSLGNQINTASENDVFLTKMDSLGNVIYSRLVGVSGDADAFGLVIDSQDNIIISGQTDSTVEKGGDNITGSLDGFIVKYQSDGDEVFRYQLDTFSETAATSITVDANDDIIVGGYAKGNIDATSTYGGGGDSLLLKIDGTDGSLASSALLGGAGSEAVKDIAMASDGNILITTVEDGVAYLKKIDATDFNNVLATSSLGTFDGTIGGIAVDGTDVYIAGTSNDAAFTGGAATTNAHGGLSDGFVTKFTDNGGSFTADFTTFIGDTGTDKISDVVVQNGNVYVAGQTNTGLAGNTKTGLIDAFAAKINGTTGAIDYIEQFGQTLGETKATSLAFATQGTTILNHLGLPNGEIHQDQNRDIVNQTSVNDGDYFYVSVNGGRQRKITIEAGDTYQVLARKLNQLSLRGVEAEVTSKFTNPQLSIKVQNGYTLELSNGPEGKNALEKLGLDPTKLLSQELLFPPNQSADGDLTEDELGGLFALKLDTAFHLKDKKTAEYVSVQLEATLNMIQRAFRSLTYSSADILLADGINNPTYGPPPAHIANKIANMQEALDRLSGGTSNYGLSV